MKERENKSQRKREIAELHKIGEQLGQLTDSQLAKIEMPERLADALVEASRIKSHGAKKRQFQFIGGLIRDMDPEEVGDYFPEFFALKQDCKFNNCLHLKEPKCAVKEALKNDEVSYSRYRSYLQILQGEEENYRTDNWDNL